MVSFSITKKTLFRIQRDPIPSCDREPNFVASPLLVRPGLTLLELMVVLVILAIVSTVAVQSLQPQVDNQRYQSASRLLNEIKTAAVGPTQKYQLDGTPLISGFIADVGRLPRIVSTSTGTETESLAELWDPNSNLGFTYPFQFRAGPNQPADYTSIRLPCGWRGPYLTLPVGTNSVRDPWGRPPTLISNANGELTDLQIEIPPTGDEQEPQIISTELVSGKVEVTGKVLLDTPENASVRVALLTPDPESSLTSLAVIDDEDEQADSFLFRNVPVGLRAIVVDANGQRQTKYVQVTHGGAVLVFDFQNRQADKTDQ
ncbi:MAG: prepilin-type N-terminal cleavage/methylation domain-containing protein [Mariniblastus sp.]|jgi:prepilin-type N-terminal cleavage/methylation domain-containing protein